MTRASISAEISKYYCKYEGRSVRGLFCIKLNITCPTDSRSLLLANNLWGEGKEKLIKFSVLTLRGFYCFIQREMGIS